MIKHAHSVLIDSHWFLTFEDHGDGTITILDHWRDTHFPAGITSMPEADKLPDFRPVEAEGRIVEAVRFATAKRWDREAWDAAETVKVRNPAHIFSYKAQAPAG